MKAFLKKAWHDPVGSKVISGIILTILGYIVVKSGEWFRSVSIMDFLANEITLSVIEIINWSIGIVWVVVGIYTISNINRFFKKFVTHIAQRNEEDQDTNETEDKPTRQLTDSEIGEVVDDVTYGPDFYKFKNTDMYRHFGDIIHRTHGNFAFSDVAPEVVSFYRSQDIIKLSPIKPYPDCFVLTSRGDTYARHYYDEKYQ
ncbi:MAG: hypothetical protein IPP71_19835 [Bacteroidetes bacterium]|nr:hypothetical protein [Bacteroidota bacterium]